MPEISIIVPFYNCEKFLHKCLSSIKLQSFTSYEVICVNDGSTDNSLSIVDEFCIVDKRFRVVSQLNKGISVARNSGLSLATGKFIGFVDGDDYIEPSMFQELHALINSTNSDFVCCGVNVVYQSLYNKMKSDEKYFSISNGNNINVTKESFYKVNVVLWNKLFRRDVIDKFNLRFPSGCIFEDASFVFCYLAVATNYSNTDKKLYNYIRYSDSIMGRTFNRKSNSVDHLRICFFCLDFLEKHNLFRKYNREFIDFFKKNIWLTLRLSKISDYGMILNEISLLLLRLDKRSNNSLFNFGRAITFSFLVIIEKVTKKLLV